MKLARANTPLCLVADRFIIAAGGQISSSSFTKEVEIYSINDNKWFQGQPLSVPRANTSMAKFGSRHIFIFNGFQNQYQSTQLNCIEYLDLVSLDQKTMSATQWVTLTIGNISDIHQTKPSCPILLLNVIDLSPYLLSCHHMLMLLHQTNLLPLLRLSHIYC